MITAPTIEDLQLLLTNSKTASKKVKELNPEIKILEPGLYEIQGSKHPYLVRCGKTEQGFPFIACQCYGALHGKVCKHSYLVLSLHLKIKLAEQREKDEEFIRDIDAPYLKSGSDKKPDKIGNFTI